MNFEPGQWYITAIGRRAEIVGVDSVRIGREEGEVIAYRYDGKDRVHMRTTDLAGNWRLEGTLAVGDEVRYKQITCGVRSGDAERKVITHITDRLVCFDVFSFDGRHLAEHALKRAEFDAWLERDPS